MKKILFVVVLIFCLFTTTEVAYAYFDQDDIEIINEEGSLYKLNETDSNSDKTLIPLDAILGENDTYVTTYTYEVYVEDGVDFTAEVTNIKWGDHYLNDEELEEIYTFEVLVDQIKAVELSRGLFTDTQEGSLYEIRINISINNSDSLKELMTNYGSTLNFDTLLTVSKS